MKKPTVSLRFIFIIPFLTIIILTAGVSSYFSFRYGRQAVDKLAGHLQDEIVARVRGHLQEFLAIPFAINEGNARALRLGLLDLDNPMVLERHFWNQVKVYNGISPIYVGYAQGGLVMALRREVPKTGRLGNEVRISTSSGQAASAQHIYAVDELGNRRELVEKLPNYDVRTRPWFKSAVERGHPGWSPVFTSFAGDAIVISANQPVYDEQGKLMGVVCADLNLTYISDFLRGLKIGKNGRVFITEQSGDLVATSAREEPLRKKQGSTQAIRIKASESDDPLVRMTAPYLMNAVGNDAGMPRQMSFEIQGERQIVTIRSFDLKSGSGWLIGVVVPESDFMAPINKNRQIAVVLISIAVFVSAVISVLGADWLTVPIRDLSLAATSAAQGDWVQIPETKRRDDLGGLIRGFNQMIRQLKDNFGKLKESESNLRAFIDNTEDTICARDREGALIFWNEAFNKSCKNLFGVEAQVGLKTGDLIPPEQREKIQHIRESWRRVFDGERVRDEFTYTWPNGENHFFEASWSPIRIDDEIVGAAEITRDITEKKRAEQELREAEQRYRTVADFTYDWEYWESPDGKMLYMSPSCERVSGYSAEAFINNSDLLQEIILSEDRTRWTSHQHNVRSKSEPMEVVFRIRTKGGEIRWIQHACQPVHDSAGTFLGVRASNRDITNIRKMKTEAEKLRAELSQMDRVSMMGVLTAGIAHEINQPLAAILSNAQAALRLMTDDPPDLEEVKGALRDIISDDKRAGEIVHSIRNIMGKYDLKREEIDLNETVKEVLTLVRSESLSRGILILGNLQPDIPPVNGDRIQIQQVILNLVMNSLEVLRGGHHGSEPEIIVSIQLKEKKDVILSVSDNGPGIQQDRLDTIFEPFKTTKKTGMGIGLSICRSIIDSHGGHIWAENRPEGGAIIFCRLPIFNSKK